MERRERWGILISLKPSLLGAGPRHYYSGSSQNSACNSSCMCPTKFGQIVNHLKEMQLLRGIINELLSYDCSYMTTKLASCPIVDGSGPVSLWLLVITLHIPIEIVSICIEQNTGNKSPAYNIAPSIFSGDRSL